MNEIKFNEGMMDFIQASPTPFHAVEQMRLRLEAAGFQQLFEADAWKLKKGKAYFVTRNDSSIIAFRLGKQDVVESGVHMVGAHTDSPCLKVKPQPEIVSKGYFQLGIEVYGGALLNPWFDRDLSLAGRINYIDHAGDIHQALVNFETPIAIIPSLAIHLDREVNQNRSINAQKDLPPVVLKLPGNEKPDFRLILLQLMKTQCKDCDVAEILDYELSFYDVQPPSFVGLHQDFIASARLDNLLSCYTGLMALLEAGKEGTSMLICSDHEEVGSASTSGAQGTFLKSVLERIVGTGEHLSRSIHQSMLISTDNAHGVHPNFADKHDDNHGAIINQGPVIKVNANQRYASNSETAAIFRRLCHQADVPVQSFVMRNDMACGSTIGPITASGIGIKTLDVGVPTFAMHSVRELAGYWDGWYLYRVLKEFYA
ncbi:MAG: M18 family aminopeptidase [Gammaproteobacteria bacterium]|nr:MAG: M18 family aminopeptidase [Gammaproteobacteria bacterium]